MGADDASQREHGRTGGFPAATSGRIGDVTWWSRQLTGTPYVTRGYIEQGGVKQACGHDHRKPARARECARRLARKVAHFGGAAAAGADPPER